METEKKYITNQQKCEEVMFSNLDSLENFTALGFKMLIEATKKCNNFPTGKSRDLYECYPSFCATVENQTDFTLSTLSSMLKHTNCRGFIQNKDDEEKFEMVVDSNDSLLENVGILLDELSGVGKRTETKFISNKLNSVNSFESKHKDKKVVQKDAVQVLNKILSQTKNIEKPQLKFKDKINNDSKIPFEPRIKHKYNMLKPLACVLETSEDGICQFTHPYEFELKKFKPMQEQMTYQPAVLYRPLEETPLVLINVPEEIVEMVNDLEKYKEIAVDLEHHSYRSFQGFTCLMQISTRDKDYIIDALSLRADLEILNKVFTNPSIVKVFHGADSDILWLQRDLSLFVVNMFDTHQAAKLLNFPKLSLSYLLSYYCNIEAQKQFQLADWRIRPLPEELLTYAREDTHYLLFIYDNLRNALIKKANNQTNLLESVISEGVRICCKRYLKPIYDSDGYLDLYHRSKKLFDNRQKFALQRLFEWRDIIARELDESYAYILPDHMMLNISEVLPREAQGILACCNPIPIPVRQNLSFLHQIILKAREQQLLKPILEEQRFYRYTSSVTSLDNPLQCPHDLNYEVEFRDDLPVLFSGNGYLNLDKNNFSYTVWDCSQPIINVFEISPGTSEKVKFLSVAKKPIHLTPYYRYKLSKKFSESVEIKSLRTYDKPVSEKVHNNISLSEVNKEQCRYLDNVQNRSGNSSNINDLIINNETDSNDKEHLLGCNKSQINDKKFEPVKKLKEVISIATTHQANEKAKKATECQKKKKKKKTFLKAVEKGFQPFDYNSVDFKKYQNSTFSSPGTKKDFVSKKGKKVSKKRKKVSKFHV